MPRKSKELRLNQAVALSNKWAQSPFANDKAHRFIDDMVGRLSRGKGLSAGQRRWLDSLIESGVPSVAEGAVDGVTAIETAIKTFHDACSEDYNWEINVLRDFRNRVAKGYSMSVKQESLLNRLITEANKIASGDVWSPSENQLADLTAAAKLYNSYTRLWKAERPAVYRAVLMVEKYASGESKTLKEKHAEKLLYAVRGRFKKFKSPRFKAGDLGKNDNLGPVVCMTDVYINEHGNIVNDWIDPDGRLVTIDQDRVKKR